VPYLPSLNSYAHVAFGVWIPTNATVVLEDRPPEDISNLNWCASEIRSYSDPSQWFWFGICFGVRLRVCGLTMSVKQRIQHAGAVDVLHSQRQSFSVWKGSDTWDH